MNKADQLIYNSLKRRGVLMFMSFESKMGLLRGLILLMSLGLMTFSCEVENPDLVGCWTHAYEEGQTIYKGCDSQTFGLSRFRQVYDFRADGTVNYLVLHPADAHYMDEAKWEYVSNRNQVLIKDIETNKIIKTLRVSILDQAKLSIAEVR
ncbi:MULTISPECIES: hypothetical protein [unclassified Roseivirga]|jgi:hypothetical protein|uniref:hypothetical protein n=1 Tax=unclassified Roseivirga TaxID=2626142 RepID=UPI00257F2D75|nr:MULTISPECIES: hypothetical protein [unclassified Roseivirga]|tara:strand:+ start:4241 stop:4693 length:453 start_codon:yes stop_codon:yes gene_type:complete